MKLKNVLKKVKAQKAAQKKNKLCRNKAGSARASFSPFLNAECRKYGWKYHVNKFPSNSEKNEHLLRAEYKKNKKANVLMLRKATAEDIDCIEKHASKAISAEPCY